jgi:hypothetical protein
VDDIADVAQQVFEIQLRFTRPASAEGNWPPRPANYLAASPRR